MAELTPRIMTSRAFGVFIVLSVSKIAAQCGPIWAYVPADRGAPQTGSIETAYPQLENVVKVIGEVATIERPNLPVNSFAIPEPVEGGSDESQKAGPDESAIPANAFWPKANDTITFVPPVVREPSGVTRIRNPWESRVGKRSHNDSTVLSCGGIIVGGNGGNIAMLNGHIVKRGDIIGRFVIDRVLPAAVVLDRDGAPFVIPLGRHVTIENVAE
jgi:hypothetical protein